jgi:ankyrin repeat protein
VIFRGVELSEATLESYRGSVGHLFAWPLFTSFTEKRAEAEEYGRAWRGGVPVMFELRSAWCRRLRTGTFLQHPYAVLQVEAVMGNAVRLVELELSQTERVREVPRRRPGVKPKEGSWTELHEAAKCGDVRAIMTFASRGEFINAREAAEGRTPLAVAAQYGRIEAVKALLWLGANANASGKNGATPLLWASQEGHEATARALASFGANVNTPDKDGVTPVSIASQNGHEATVRTLVSFRAEVNMPNKDGVTAVYIASQQGHEATVRALVSFGANVNMPNKDGATPVYTASQQGHEPMVRAFESL